MQGAREDDRLAPTSPPPLLQEQTMLLIAVLQQTGVAFAGALGGPLVHIPPRNQVYAKYVFRCKVLK